MSQMYNLDQFRSRNQKQQKKYESYLKKISDINKNIHLLDQEHIDEIRINIPGIYMDQNHMERSAKITPRVNVSLRHFWDQYHLMSTDAMMGQFDLDMWCRYTDRPVVVDESWEAGYQVALKYAMCRSQHNKKIHGHHAWFGLGHPAGVVPDEVILYQANEEILQEYRDSGKISAKSKLKFKRNLTYNKTAMAITWSAVENTYTAHLALNDLLITDIHLTPTNKRHKGYGYVGEWF